MKAPNRILWQPTAERIASSELTRFARFAAHRHGAPAVVPGSADGYAELHAWSVRERGAFWTALWEHAGVLGDRGARVVLDSDRMPGARWFPDARLNYAENLLAGPADEIALVARDETGERRTLTRGELHVAAGSMAAAFAAAGITSGDVVAGFVGNTLEAAVAMLAAAWLGAVWTSTPPEFGAPAVIERFGQTGAKLLVAATRYRYAGKTFDCAPKIASIARAMPQLATVVLVGDSEPLPAIAAATRGFSDWLAQGLPAPPFARVPFDAPLYVLFSSGTTGKPKAIAVSLPPISFAKRNEMAKPIPGPSPSALKRSRPKMSARCARDMPAPVSATVKVRRTWPASSACACDRTRTPPCVV
jgi:acetoacetyl-CoA synthetase